MSRKHIRELRAVVEPLGVEVVQAKSGHFQMRHQGQFVATVAASPRVPGEVVVRRAFRDAVNYLNRKAQRP